MGEFCLQCSLQCIDDMIKELRLAGYGVRVGAQYVGSVLYADDIALLAGSCYKLQKMLDICTEYGHTWDITLTQLEASYLQWVERIHLWA